MLQLLATPEIGVFIRLKNDCLVQLAGTNVADTKAKDFASTSTAKGKRARSHSTEQRSRKRRRKQHPLEDDAYTETPMRQPVITLQEQPTEVAVPEIVIHPLSNLTNQPSTRFRGRALGLSKSAPDLTTPQETGAAGQPPTASKRLTAAASNSNLLESQTAGDGAIQTAPPEVVQKSRAKSGPTYVHSQS